MRCLVDVIMYGKVVIRPTDKVHDTEVWCIITVLQTLRSASDCSLSIGNSVRNAYASSQCDHGMPGPCQNKSTVGETPTCDTP
jgi:hypothetical protein